MSPTSSSPSATCMPSSIPTSSSTSSTCTRCCNTLPTRSPRAAEMRRVRLPDGVVVARLNSIDPARSPGTRADARLDQWLDLYCAVAEANGGEPDAGSRLLAWVLDAGLLWLRHGVRVGLVLCDGRGAIVVGRPVGRARAMQTALAARVEELGLATADALGGTCRGLAGMGRRLPNGWFAVLHGEVLRDAVANTPRGPAFIADSSPWRSRRSPANPATPRPCYIDVLMSSFSSGDGRRVGRSWRLPPGRSSTHSRGRGGRAACVYVRKVRRPTRSESAPRR